MPFCFYFLKGFFVSAEDISIKVYFFWERKRGKGNLGFGSGDVLFWFFPFLFPLIWKIITWWKKQEKVWFILLTIKLVLSTVALVNK